MTAALKPARVTFQVFGLFLLFFSVLFVQFPLAGSLPGYVDTWLYLGLFNDYGNHVEAWFTGQPLGSCLYPAGPPYAYLEPSFASAGFFLFFKLLRFNDLWAYYGFLVSIFTLNATAAFVLARQYLGKVAPAIFTALAFAASSFAFGNIENQNTLAYFPALICIYHFREYLMHRNGYSLVVAMLAGGLQIYFGTYTFIFQSLVLFMIGLVHYRTLFFANGWWPVLKALPIYALLVLPYMVTYLMNPELAEFYNPSRNDPGTIEAMSLNINDLYRALPNNLVYPIQTDLPQIFVYNLRAASLGVVFYVLALIGFLARPVFRKEAGLVALVSFIIALGPSITVGGHTLTMPMGLLYQTTDIGAFLRHPARMFFFTSLMLALFAGHGVWAVARKLQVPVVLVLLLASGVYVIENVPFPFEKFDSKPYIVEGNPYPEITTDNGQPAIVLELPSTLDFISNDLGKPFNQFSREYIYMYWQSKHGQHSLNGAVAFFPPQRLLNAQLTGQLPNNDALNELIETNGIQYIIYHPQLQLPYESSYLAFLQTHPLLRVLEGSDKHIFKVIKP